jgi:hypothetical protein
MYATTQSINIISINYKQMCAIIFLPPALINAVGIFFLLLALINAVGI